MKFPTNYSWLGSVGTLPNMVTEALKEYGTVEMPGPGNCQKILDWAKEVGVNHYYTADAVPWCGLFVALIAKRANKGSVSLPLWALSWAKFGKAAGQPVLGDILVFTRNGGGHVGIYIAEDKEYYHVLGGNQSDSVSITRVAKIRLFAARRPRTLFGLPKSARSYMVSGTGTPITTNEH